MATVEVDVSVVLANKLLQTDEIIAVQVNQVIDIKVQLHQDVNQTQDSASLPVVLPFKVKDNAVREPVAVKIKVIMPTKLR